MASQTNMVQRHFQNCPFSTDPQMKGVIKQNRHIATASAITKTNVNEDKIVSSRTCVKIVGAHIIDKYAQREQRPGSKSNTTSKQFTKPAKRNTNSKQAQH